MKYQILVLTDHSGHSESNSVYSLVRGLIRHNDVSRVFVASQGNTENQAFFAGEKSNFPMGRPATPDFAFDATGAWFSSEQEPIDINDVDLIFLRLPPPVRPSLFASLEKNYPNTCVINRPSGILKTSSKAFLVEIEELCPPVSLIYNTNDVREMAAKFPIVLKPLNAYGGKGILRIAGNTVYDGDESYPLDALKIPNDEQPTYLAMKFLKNVGNGDKRTIVVNGEIMGSSLRLPPPGSWLCNVAQGGRAEDADLTPEELKMGNKLSQVLLPLGIVIFGFDTLEDDDGKRVLSEINTMSIGGFDNVKPVQEGNIVERTVQLILNYLKDFKQ